MAKTVLCAGSGAGVIPAVSGTRYYPVGNSYFNGSSTETDRQITLRAAGTFSNLYTYVSANDRTSSSTLRFRKNTANGNQAVTIPSSTTGEFEDTTSTDVVAVGDVVNYALAMGAGGTTQVYRFIQTLFDAASAYTPLVVSGYAGFSTASSTQFTIPGATDAAVGTNERPVVVRVAGSMKHLFINVTANARTTSTTFKSRKNSADGTLSVSVGSSTTGIFEDTTHSDNLAAGDSIALAIATGSGTGSITPLTWSIALETTTADGLLVTGKQAGITYATASSTAYLRPTGNFTAGSLPTAETDEFIRPKFAGTASKLGIRVTANTSTNTATLTLRKNAVDSAVTLSIAGSTTGVFEDTTHSVAIVASDKLDHALTMGSGTASVAFTAVWFVISGVSAVTGAQATETDTANAGTPVAFIAGSMAIETDSANAGTRGGLAAGAMATESDTPGGGAALGTVAGARATEADTPSAGAEIAALIGAKAVEFDTPAAGALRGTVVGALAVEIDTASPGSATATVLGGMAIEVDTAVAGAAHSTVVGGQAIEVNTANAGGLLVVVVGTRSTEIDTASPGAVRVTVLGARADEVDTANAGSPLSHGPPAVVLSATVDLADTVVDVTLADARAVVTLADNVLDATL